jgi:hypothetical protein
MPGDRRVSLASILLGAHRSPWGPQALSGELINDGEHAEGPAVVRAILNEVVGPDVARVLRGEDGYMTRR